MAEHGHGGHGHAAPEHPEYMHHLETSHASRGWMDKVNRVIGHLGLTGMGELWTTIGSFTGATGLKLSLLTANPLPAMVGAIPTVMGMAHEHMTGGKFASNHEQVITKSLGAAWPIATAIAPQSWLPIAAFRWAASALSKRFRP